MRGLWAARRLFLKLRCIWFLLVAALVIGPAIAYWQYPAAPWWNVGTFVLGSFLSLGISSLFSCPEEILLRGAPDTVYLVENRFFLPKVKPIENPETFEALGFRWRDIVNVTEALIRLLPKEDPMDIMAAELIAPLPGQRSYFAILGRERRGVRYLETVRRIWGSDYRSKEKVMTIKELNKFAPGKDLVPVQDWSSAREPR